VAVAMGFRQFGIPGSGTSAVGSRYQRASEGKQTKKTKRVCTELQPDYVK
jgi:hypothetical protein